jgi:D-alanyl-D-alanine carboxypeptidase (penicillin-binding protein 5/6)
MIDQSVKISYDAVAAVTPSIRRHSGKHPSYRLEFGGTHMWLKAGEELSLRTLLYGLMLNSGNDAANALAEYTSGSIPQFMVELNHFLKAIGCTNTHFTNPHGLSDPLHVTTAYDLALMTYYAMKYPIFCEVVKTTKYQRPKTNKQDESYLVQHNALLKPGKHFYPYAIGVKTGYTTAAGKNLVAAAEKEGRRVIAVVLNCEEMSQHYRSCISLFEAAFNEAKVERKLFSQQHDFFSFPMKGAKDSIEAMLQKDVILEYYPSEEQALQAKLHWDPVSLPIAAGQRVGEIRIIDEKGKIVLRESLLSKRDVSPTLSYQVSEGFSTAANAAGRHKLWIGLALGGAFVGLAYVLRSKKQQLQK